MVILLHTNLCKNTTISATKWLAARLYECNLTFSAVSNQTEMLNKFRYQRLSALCFPQHPPCGYKIVITVHQGSAFTWSSIAYPNTHRFLHSGVTGGGGGQGEECPTSDWEIFADVSGKKRKGKKGKRDENWEEKKESYKREGWKLEMEVGKVIKEVRTLGLPKWEFSSGEKAFHAGKKIRKKWLVPSEKYACYAPVTARHTNLHSHVNAVTLATTRRWRFLTLLPSCGFGLSDL